jgi:hypothetical protein
VRNSSARGNYERGYKNKRKIRKGADVKKENHEGRSIEYQSDKETKEEEETEEEDKKMCAVISLTPAIHAAYSGSSPLEKVRISHIQ